MNARRLSFVRGSMWIVGTAVVIVAGHMATAALPAPDTTFSVPTTVDNPYFPIVPGAVKVFAGRDRRHRVMSVTKHRSDVRAFAWGDREITCRAIDTHAFVDGQLQSVRTAYFAQSDDGAVYRFGEVRRPEETGLGGWVVGARHVDDPVTTASLSEPVLVVPGIPETGDRWTTTTPTASHVLEIRDADTRVHVRGGTARHALRLVRTAEGERTGETSWLAPGLGPVKWRSDASRLRLDATTLDRERRVGRR